MAATFSYNSCCLNWLWNSYKVLVKKWWHCRLKRRRWSWQRTCTNHINDICFVKAVNLRAWISTFLLRTDLHSNLFFGAPGCPAARFSSLSFPFKVLSAPRLVLAEFQQCHTGRSMWNKFWRHTKTVDPHFSRESGRIRARDAPVRSPGRAPGPRADESTARAYNQVTLG